MEQNTQAWLDWRLDGFGASDSNILAGCSKGKRTIQDLLEEKITRKMKPVKNDFILRKGHQFEEIARAKYELLTDREWPPKLFEREDKPFMRASLDGFCEGVALEIKYVGKKDFELVKSGKMIPEYYAQLQKQIYVSGAEYNVLFVINDDKETASLMVKPDLPYIKELVSRETKYWQMVQDKKIPDDGTHKLDDKQGAQLSKYLILERQIKTLKQKSDEIKKELFENVSWTKAKYNNIRLTISNKKGSIDYQKAYEATSVKLDLESFRKKGSIMRKIHEEKKEV